MKPNVKINDLGEFTDNKGVIHQCRVVGYTKDLIEVNYYDLESERMIFGAWITPYDYKPSGSNTKT